MKADVIYYSATGTTKSIAHAFAEGLCCETAFYDLTLPQERAALTGGSGDVAVFALPVYSERFPRFVLEILERIEGGDRPLIGISVYGNIGFGITLEEYQAFAARRGMRFIAAGAMIGQHTYASESSPIGLGRPDAADLEQAREFGRRVREKIENGDDTPAAIPKPSLPRWVADLPENGVRFLLRQPRVNSETCNRCGACAARCPAGAIDAQTLAIEEKRCLRCGACVQVCPRSARDMRFYTKAYEKIFAAAGKKRRENRFFL